MSEDPDKGHPAMLICGLLGEFVTGVGLGDEHVSDGVVGGEGVAVGDDFRDGEGLDGDDEGFAGDGLGGEVGADGFGVDEVGLLEVAGGDGAEDDAEF